MEGRATYVAAGGKEFNVIPCLNEHPLWIAALADLAFRNLAGWLAQPPDVDARELTLVRAKAMGAPRLAEAPRRRRGDRGAAPDAASAAARCETGRVPIPDAVRAAPGSAGPRIRAWVVRPAPAAAAGAPRVARSPARRPGNSLFCRNYPIPFARG